MAVAAVVRSRGDARKASRLHAVRSLGVQGIERAVTDVHIGVHGILPHLARHDVDDAAHRIRSVKHRGGAAHHLYPFGQHRLIGVGYGMPHETHVLRMAVDEHQHARRGRALRAVAYAAHGHGPRRSRRDAVPHHASARHEQSRDLFRQRRQERGAFAVVDPLAVDYGYGHRQMPDVGLVAGARDYDFAYGMDFFVCEGVGFLSVRRGQRCEAHGCKKNTIQSVLHVGSMVYLLLQVT